MSGRDGARGAQTKGGLPLQRVAREAQASEIRRVMRDCGGRIVEAAELLGLSRQGLYDAAARAGIILPDLAQEIAHEAAIAKRSA